MSIATAITTPAVVCLPTADITQVARMMHEHDIGCVVIVDLDQRPVGIVTDRDLVTRALASGRARTTAVSDVMSRDPATITLDHDTVDAARQMADHECRRLPVINPTGQVVGVITFDDLILRAGHTLDELNRIVTVERAGRGFAKHTS